jgi:hypothetical protein
MMEQLASNGLYQGKGLGHRGIAPARPTHCLPKHAETSERSARHRRVLRVAAVATNPSR